ncbi:hypothetical protein ACS0TY_007187 [Phlomoides rotata]
MILDVWHILSDIGKLINLNTLMLSSNQLTGHLPTSFTTLANLNDLMRSTYNCSMNLVQLPQQKLIVN